MSGNNVAGAYRQYAARGASPAAITGMIYDVAIESLNRAIRAIDRGDIPERVAASNKFFAVIAELRSALDYERGGEVARRLGRFYQIARGEVLQANIRIDRALFQKYARLFGDLREAWKKVERDCAGTVPAPESRPVTIVRAPKPDSHPVGSRWDA
jgi:flagellar secretion chaperone FliS